MAEGPGSVTPPPVPVPVPVPESVPVQAPNRRRRSREVAMTTEVRHSRQGKHPNLTTPSQKLRVLHVQATESLPQLTPSSYDLTQAYVTCSKSRVSTKPMSKLSKMQLDELRVREHCVDRYLELRTLESVYEHNGLITVVEDDVGKAVKFWAHYFPIYSNGSEIVDLKDVLPVGTTFLLKEPYCDETEYGECVLHCKSQSDMIIVYEGLLLYQYTAKTRWQNIVEFNYANQLPLPENAEEWAWRGKTLWNAGKLECALRCYTATMPIFTQGKEVRTPFYRSTLMDYVKLLTILKWYENALKVCHLLCRDTNDHEAFRMAAEIYQKLRKYEDALEFAEKSQKCPNGDGEGIQNIIEYLKRLLKEKNTGDYNMYDILTIQNSPLTTINCADYKGPVEIKFKETKGHGIVATEVTKGHGIVATEDIKPGTLLTASKAMVFSYKPQVGEVPHTEVWRELMNQLVILLLGSPEAFGVQVYSLFDGKTSRKGTSVFCDVENKSEPIVDVCRLAGILKNNLFGDGCDLFRNKKSMIRSNQVKAGCGLFDWASYFKHSCLPNAYIMEIHDMIFIRANQRIKKGSAIYVSYISWEIPYPMRRAHILSREFNCECKLCKCESELSEEFLGVRQNLLTDYEGVYRRICEGNIDNHPRIIDLIHRMIKKFEDTSKTNGSYPQEIFLSAVYALLAKAMGPAVTGDGWDPEKELEYHLLSLEYLGFNTLDVLGSLTRKPTKAQNALVDLSAIYAVHEITSIYSHLGNLENKKIWHKILWEFEKICSGVDEKAMLLKYRHLGAIQP